MALFLGLSLNGRSRAQWWSPGAIIDVDDQNGRWFVNGTVYSSKASMVTAGVLTQLGGVDTYAVSLPSAYTFAAKGLTASTTVTSPARYLARLDNGSDAEVAQFWQGASGSQYLHCEIFAGSVSQGPSFPGAGWSVVVGNSAVVRAAVRVEANNLGFTVNGGPVGTDLIATAPAVTQLTIANRADGLRPWAGTFYRATIVSGAGTDAQLRALLA